MWKIVTDWESVNSDNVAIASHNQEIQVTFAEKPMMKIKSLKKQKHGYFIHT